MAKFAKGDYVLVPGLVQQRARIEVVVQDGSTEDLVIYFIVSDRGACGCISGDGLRKDFSGLPSDKIADEKTASLRGQIEALVRGLPRAQPSVAVKIGEKKKELEDKISEIERLWRPKYSAGGFQPFNNLEPVQNIVYIRTELKRMPTNFYYGDRGGARVVLDPRDVGMEFVILKDEPNVILVGTVGHSPMALGRQTIYAGHVRFDTSGRLVEWNNNTGHYKTIAQYAYQAASVLDPTGSPILPLEKFTDLAPVL